MSIRSSVVAKPGLSPASALNSELSEGSVKMNRLIRVHVAGMVKRGGFT
jgi:hypothetical protein